MNTLYTLLLLLALLSFAVAAVGRTATRINLVALGLAFWVAVPLIQTLRVS